MRHSALLCALPLLLTGCVGAAISAGTEAGVSVAENRSIGRKVDDTVIYTDLTNQFIQANKSELLSHVTFNVRYGRVMLTGRVPKEEDAQKAVELSWKAKGVTEVINELVVAQDISVLDTANDSFIKRNLESRLLITKGVWVINYSIDVQSGVAYLIGRVKDQGELDRALNVARTTKGVKRVVSHLQINADTQQPTTPPNGSVQPYTSPSYNNGSSGMGSSAMSSSPASDPNASTIDTGPVYTNTSPAYNNGSAPISTATTPGVASPGSVSSAPLAPPASGGY